MRWPARCYHRDTAEADHGGTHFFFNPVGTGLRGASPGHTGVVGASGSGGGVEGISNSGPGVFGERNSAPAIWGISTSGPGVVGASDSGDAVRGERGEINTGVLEGQRWRLGRSRHEPDSSAPLRQK